jgi:hypothetical protein
MPQKGRTRDPFCFSQACLCDEGPCAIRSLLCLIGDQRVIQAEQGNCSASWERMIQLASTGDHTGFEEEIRGGYVN